MQVYLKPKFPYNPTANHPGQDTVASQRCQVLKPIQPPADKRCGTKPAPGRGYHSRPNRRKYYVSASPQPRKKREYDLPTEHLPSPTPPEDCISRLPVRNLRFTSHDEWPNILSTPDCQCIGRRSFPKETRRLRGCPAND